MKKVVLTVLAAFLLVVIIASCSEDNNQDQVYTEVEQIDKSETKESDI